MPNFKVLKSAFFPLSLLLGTGSVFGGCAAAVSHGNLEIMPAFLCLLFVWTSQLASNIGYSFQDYRNGNTKNILTASDGHVFPSIAGISTYHLLRELTYALSILAAMFGIAIINFADWWVLFLGIFVALVAYVNNAPPFPLVRTAAAPLVTFLLFGPLCVIGTSLVQSQTGADNMLNWFDLGPAVYIGIAMGFLAANAHICYLFMTYPVDREAGYRTLLVRCGTRWTTTVFIISLLLGILFLATLAVNVRFTYLWMPVTVCAIPLIFGLISISFIIRTKLPKSGLSAEEKEEWLKKTKRGTLVANVGFLVTGIALFLSCLFTDFPNLSGKVLFFMD